MFKRILVPTDGSDLSLSAVRAAMELAKRLGATVVGLHVMPVFESMVYPESVMYSAITYDEFNEETDKEAAKALAAVSDAAQQAGVACTTVKNRFTPAFEGVLAAAKEQNCDLIVMASHGRRGVKALVLGSETNKVLTHSKIPVLVYR